MTTLAIVALSYPALTRARMAANCASELLGYFVGSAARPCSITRRIRCVTLSVFNATVGSLLGSVLMTGSSGAFLKTSVTHPGASFGGIAFGEVSQRYAFPVRCTLGGTTV